MRKAAEVTKRKSDKIWRDAILRAVARRESKKDPQAVEKLAEALVAKGIDGDVSALREIGDRLDGKPAQTIMGDAAAPVHMRVSWVSPKR